MKRFCRIQLRGAAWKAAMLCAGIGGALLGCESDGNTYGAKQPCTMPCKPVDSGNTFGPNAASVDVSGSIVQLTTPAFDKPQPYTKAVKVIAMGPDKHLVEVPASDGEFDLTDALAGPSWLLVRTSNSQAGGVFSTYSGPKELDGKTSVVLQVVPFDLLADIVAPQITVKGLVADRAHVVMQITNEEGKAIEGVEVYAFADAEIGYHVGPGSEYSTSTEGTGALGLAVALNAVAPTAGTVMLEMGYQNERYLWEVSVPLASDTVTYAEVVLPTP